MHYSIQIFFDGCFEVLSQFEQAFSTLEQNVQKKTVEIGTFFVSLYIEIETPGPYNDVTSYVDVVDSDNVYSWVSGCSMRIL